MKKALKIFLAAAVLSICFVLAAGYLRDILGLEIPTYEQTEKIFTDNDERFEKSARELVGFGDNIQVSNNKYQSSVKRDDWKYYDIGNNLTAIAKLGKSLSKNERALIKESGCKTILKNLRFRRIDVFDSCVYYVKVSNFSNSYGILYCTREETLQKMRSAVTLLAGVHIDEIKEIRDNWYYVVTE